MIPIHTQFYSIVDSYNNNNNTDIFMKILCYILPIVRIHITSNDLGMVLDNLTPQKIEPLRYYFVIQSKLLLHSNNVFLMYIGKGFSFSVILVRYRRIEIDVDSLAIVLISPLVKKITKTSLLNCTDE
jgi:hypothetical protein